MTVLEYVLDGLEKALELERELGTRSIEVDREFLGRATGETPVGPGRATGKTPVGPGRGEIVELSNCRIVESIDQSTNRRIENSPPAVYDFVFLHDRPLSADGITMMAKIIQAMGKTAETAPIIIEPPVPKAKVIVILGGRALKKFLPEAKGEPGQWIKSPGGRDVLVTYSPEYILRFGAVTSAVEKIKKAMWLSLKAVKQRLGL